LFENFQSQRITTSETEIFLRTAGDGPPVLLIHGYPQTHTCWHAVAPQLAEHFSVVVPDLRGYGASDKPPPDAEHRAYSKRAMARDLAEVMTALGHETFLLVGHDRGARVGYRLCLDHAERVTRFCSLDVVPTLDMWETIDKKRAIGAFHWSFLAQPAPFPETFIGYDSDGFHTQLMSRWAAPGFEFNSEAMSAYLRAMRDPKTIQATCEDYRAGATLDPEYDAADRDAGRKIACPMLFLWGGARGFGGPQGGASPLDVWRDWCAAEVTGGAIDCGHFLPEEAPDEVVAQLLKFLVQG
jgi:haloacetate dehalogenase